MRLEKTGLVFDRTVPPAVIVKFIRQFEGGETLFEIVSAGARPALHNAVIPDLVNTVFFKNIR